MVRETDNLETLEVILNLRFRFPFDHIVKMPDGVSPWNAVLCGRNIDGLIAENAKVAIVGSGISAAVISYELSKFGINIDIFESEDLVGGRISTLRFPDGQYGELGAMRIPSNHQVVIDYIRELNLETRPFVNWNRTGTVYFANEYFDLSQSDATDAKVLFKLKQQFPNLRHNVFEEIRNGPARAFESLVAQKILDKLNTAQDAIDILLQPEFRNPEIRSLMDMNLGDFAVSSDCGLTQDEWFLLSRVSGMAAFNTCPVQQFLLGMLPVLDSDEILEITGGTDRIVEALISRAENTRVKIGHSVDYIEQSNTLVSVAGKSNFDGEFQSNGYDHVIITAPPKSLEMIQIRGSETAIEIKDSIEALTIRPLLKVLINFSENFWGHREGLIATDLSIAQVWYPSSRHDGNSPESTVLVASYRWADLAAEWMHVPDEQIIEKALNDLSVLHSIDVVKLKRLMKHNHVVKWPEAYTLLERDKFDELCDLQEQDDGDCRIHFAGEHTSLLHATLSP